MITFNKVQDVYHTLTRMHAILNISKSKSLPEKALYLIDFIACFPQHISKFRKRQFKFLKGISSEIEYRGNLQSHFYLLNKTQLAALRLMRAKGIVTVDLGKVSLKMPLQISDSILQEGIVKLIHTIEEVGYEELNSSLRIFEDRYETSN